MRKITTSILLIFSFSAYAGLPPWKNLPRQEEPIKLSKKFNAEYWELLNYRFKASFDEKKSIKAIINKMGSGELFKYDHHAFVCYKNESNYLYIYDSGWGPGYALVNEPIPYIQRCTTTNKPLKIGAPIKLGQQRLDVEKVINAKTRGRVVDLSYEEIINEKIPPNKICPTWYEVSLKIIFTENIVTGIYFDDHSEPYDDCKTI